MHHITGTKLTPQAVFSVVGVLPKTLQDDFRQKCWSDQSTKEDEFVPDPVLKYDHPLGLTWLHEHDIPNTVEGLDEQRQMVFKTMISGPETYNVGQFFVLFPEVVYSSRDIDSTIMVVEVMDELEFPAHEDLIAQATDEIRSAGDEEAAFAIRAALMSYVVSGKIKIHQAGMRMYYLERRYQFEERFTQPDEKPLSFKDAARRNRKPL